MSNSTRAFKTKGAVPVDDVAAALQPAFTVHTGPENTTARTWLDTFDWRLHSAGIPLEYSNDGPLTAHLPNGTTLNCPLPGRDWPLLAEQLPAGRVRDTVTEVVTPRALLPVVTLHRTVRESRVLNDDDKTVARLVFECGDDGVGWLQVHPLRGYNSDGDRIARRLADVAGLIEASMSPYDEALTHANRTPDDADSGFRLEPDLPAPVAIAAILEDFARVIDDNVPGTIEAIDVEFLHDLRVAVRRTRSVLKLVGDALPDDLAARFIPEFKWLGDLTTPVRDLDVYLLGFRDMAAGLASASPHDLDPFRSFLVHHRTAERRRLVRGLRSRRFERLLTDWHKELAEVRDSAQSRAKIGALLEQRLGRTFKRVVKLGREVTADSPSENVHALRKRCKELRYLLEISRPLDTTGTHRQLIKELKALQNTLGDFQDGEVQREAVREFAAVMMEKGAAPPETVLAMGELAAQLDAHQLRARADLEDRLQPLLGEQLRSLGKAKSQ